VQYLVSHFQILGIYIIPAFIAAGIGNRIVCSKPFELHAEFKALGKKLLALFVSELWYGKLK